MLKAGTSMDGGKAIVQVEEMQQQKRERKRGRTYVRGARGAKKTRGPLKERR